MHKRLFESVLLNQLFGKNFIDFLVAWNRFGHFAIRVDVVSAAVTEKIPSILFKKLHQISSFHSITSTYIIRLKYAFVNVC